MQLGQRRFLATVKIALFLPPPYEAVIVTTVLLDTGTVVTVKVTDPLPAGTVMFADVRRHARFVSLVAG